jgi:hypothetical protein
MNKNQIDHDRLFKELLETFFAEFMNLHYRRNRSQRRTGVDLGAHRTPVIRAEGL